MQFYVTKMRPTISCIKCGEIAEAGPMTVNKWCGTTAELHTFAASQMPDIPVDWSSQGWRGNRRDLRCVRCTKMPT